MFVDGRTEDSGRYKCRVPGVAETDDIYFRFISESNSLLSKSKIKVDDLYRGSLQFDRIASKPLYNRPTPLVHWTLPLPQYGALA